MDLYRRGKRFEAKGNGVFSRVLTPRAGEVIQVPAIVLADRMPTPQEARYLLTAGRVVGGQVIHFSGGEV